MSRGRLWLRRAWLGALVVAAVGAAVMLARGRQGIAEALLSVREALFTSYSANLAELDAPPATSARSGFLTDSPASVAALTMTLRGRGLGPLLDSMATISGTVPRAQAIALGFAGPDGKGCGSVNDLASKIPWVRHGFNGCCSDHVEVFLALATTLGIFAREFTVLEHTTAEIWVPETGRWAFIDPMFWLMARDSAGRFLTTAEVQAGLRDGPRPVWEFFGNPARGRIWRRNDFNEIYAHPVRFGPLSLTEGNNVIAVDAHARDLGWLPKPASQLAGFVGGIRPRYRQYAPHATGAELAWLRLRGILLLAGLALLVAALVAYPLLRLFGRATAPPVISAS